MGVSPRKDIAIQCWGIRDSDGLSVRMGMKGCYSRAGLWNGIRRKQNQVNVQDADRIQASGGLEALEWKDHTLEEPNDTELGEENE